MCELLSLIISDVVRLSLSIGILRTAAHEVGLGQILLDWTELIWLGTGKVLGSGATAMNFRIT
jgi:hypothetical protein